MYEVPEMDEMDEMEGAGLPKGRGLQCYPYMHSDQTAGTVR